MEKPPADEIVFSLTHYKEGLFVERCHLSVYELLPAVAPVANLPQGSLHIPHRYCARPTIIAWDERGVNLSPAEPLYGDTSSIWLSRENWEWISGQLGEFEGWYQATIDELKKRG